ncbi:hypothetical protein [Alkalicoccus luteus]|uniref:Uncharacterized protein n=1 Tax=Alkalicoccus luteus TaxID=1237094 RepID=A0A969PTE6_9BACI|nr:hypothetical protein [Alkalicoccus luteus]NJP38998.1 hypothetical protein [Alkalicoccus luteus]
MKASQRLIQEYFPHIATGEEPRNDVEKTFFALYQFLSNPKTEHFDLQRLMQITLSDMNPDHARLFLQVIQTYFDRDTYLEMRPAEPLMIKEPQPQTEYLSQSDFGNYLIREGHSSWKPNKVTTYYGRGKLPEPDLYFNEKPYWTTETAKRFSQDISPKPKGELRY